MVRCKTTTSPPIVNVTHFTPASETVNWSKFETIKQHLDPVEAVEALADLSKSRPTLARLQHLCFCSGDTRFIGALLYLISTPEAKDILVDWEPESRNAAGLARLGRALWGEQEAISSLRPFKEDRRVKVEFGKKVESHYLAAMAAARRALPSDRTSAWIQRLRLYIVLRAMDALEVNVARERHLLDICRTIRNACEITGHPNWDLLEMVAGDAAGYQGFVAEATIHCRSAVLKNRGKPGKAFFESLLSVLEDRDWTPLPVEQTSLEPTELEPNNSNGDLNALIDLSAFVNAPSIAFTVFHTALEDDNAILAKHRTGAGHSPQKQVHHGQGLRLEHIERGLFLPHSWHQLSAAEESGLEGRISELLKSADLVNRFGASSTLIAWLCSHSMHDVCALALSPIASENWSLDLKKEQLVRLAPRFARRWRQENAAPDAKNWLHPLATKWTIQLRHDVCEPFRRAKLKAPNASSLQELWSAIGQVDTLAIWFNKAFTNRADLARVTSPCLANPLAMHVFQQSGDHGLARLVTSNSRTALPSSCAYAAYRAPKILDTLGVFVRSELVELIAPVLDEGLNVAGSELDVRLDLLRRTIEGLTRRVATAANSPSWVEHHNLLTALTVLSLLASTGARPVNSPFESLAWIDLVRGILYVQDKNAGPTQGSRICVLSDIAQALLQEQYLPHLRALAAAFRQSDTGFAAEIDKLFDTEAEAMLPLFFFMRDKPGIRWFEVSETELDRVCQFEWPLPWNIFRHLTATWLCRWGLPPDIRDALLGHAERSAEPHGYFSPRIPIDDLEQARPLVNRLAQELGFVMPGKWPCLPAGIHLFLTLSDSGYTRPFGRKARALRREHTLGSAQDLARTVIQEKMGNRSLDQLSPEEIDKIALAMLFREDGLPHAMGSVRYEVFEKFLKDQWRDLGVHAKVKHRYIVILEGQQLFNEDAITAGNKLSHFRESFEAFVKTRPKGSERPVIAATMAAIDLVLTSKVSNFQALCALLCNHHSIRLIHFDRKYWFEWAFGAVWKDRKPVFRVEIASRTAHWISQVLGCRTLTSVPPMPAAMAYLFTDLGHKGAGLGPLVRQLANLQSQNNALTLPGIHAGYLCGAHPSAGLPHADWIRVVKGAAPIYPTEASTVLATGELVELEEAEHFFRHHHKQVTVGGGPALKRCKELFKTIYDALSSSENNSKIASAIAKAVKTSGFSRGDAPFLLAHFAVHLLKRKPKKGTKDRLRSVTALRYWNSLAPAFLSMAAHVNLMDAEEEDLTDLYDQLIKATDFSATIKPEQATAVSKFPDEYTNATDAPLRAIKQLRDFHDFARGTYGLPDPDWAEISPDISIGVGRPGIVREPEYLAALQSLHGGNAPHALDQETLAAVFVLILCARFGLRIGEAVGLHRCDWVELAQTLTILVRSNSTRTLKTIRSKRQVPRIEDFTAIELAVLNAVLTNWTHREGRDSKTPLLPGISRTTFKAIKSEIGSRLLDAIKTITRNERSTVHMLRHAFAMRVLSLIWCKNLDLSTTADPQKSLDVRRLLTGSSSTDRRLLWAVSRLLGHASPGVTLQSYVNCLHLWLSPINSIHADNQLPVPHLAINLDLLKLSADYLSYGLNSSKPAAAKSEPAFLRCIRAVRLIGIGYNEKQAYLDSGLNPKEGAEVIKEITKVSARLSKSENRFGIFNLLNGISTPRLNALVEFVENAVAPEMGLSPLIDWELTVGPSRQVLLFEPQHFEYFASFISQLKLETTDVWLVAKRLPPVGFYGEQTKKMRLENYLHSKLEVGKTFQLDVALNEVTRQIWPDRLVVVPPSRKGKINSTFELLILWAIWHVSLRLN